MHKKGKNTKEKCSNQDKSVHDTNSYQNIASVVHLKNSYGKFEEYRRTSCEQLGQFKSVKDIIPVKSASEVASFITSLNIIDIQSLIALVETLLASAVSDVNQCLKVAELCEFLIACHVKTQCHLRIQWHQNNIYFEPFLRSYCMSLFWTYFGYVTRNTSTIWVPIRKTGVKITSFCLSFMPSYSERFLNFFGQLFIRNLVSIGDTNNILCSVIKHSYVFSEGIVSLLEIILNYGKSDNFEIYKILIAIFNPDDAFWSAYWRDKKNVKKWKTFLEIECVAVLNSNLLGKPKKLFSHVVRIIKQRASEADKTNHFKRNAKHSASKGKNVQISKAKKNVFKANYCIKIKKHILDISDRKRINSHMKINICQSGSSIPSWKHIYRIKRRNKLAKKRRLKHYNKVYDLNKSVFYKGEEVWDKEKLVKTKKKILSKETNARLYDVYYEHLSEKCESDLEVVKRERLNEECPRHIQRLPPLSLDMFLEVVFPKVFDDRMNELRARRCSKPIINKNIKRKGKNKKEKNKCNMLEQTKNEFYNEIKDSKATTCSDQTINKSKRKKKKREEKESNKSECTSFVGEGKGQFKKKKKKKKRNEKKETAVIPFFPTFRPYNKVHQNARNTNSTKKLAELKVDIFMLNNVL